jgi:hypothetical protein
MGAARTSGLSRRRRLVFGLVTALAVAAIVEVAAYGVACFLQEKGVLYDPPPHDRYAHYLEIRDPVLGWPGPDSFPDANRDVTGSRITPAFPDPARHPTRVSLYGDSFTWSSEVDHEHAWGNVLSRRLGCRVANFGAGGSGSDQAYLRFRSNEMDDAEVVFLNHLSENILRNVCQFKYLLYPGSPLSFKPRFLLEEDGALRLVPVPTFPVGRVAEAYRRPEAFLEHDYFVPGGPAGTHHFAFPYTVAVLKAFEHFHVRAELRGEPWYMDFYRAEHPAGGLELTARILTAFDRTARARGKVPVVTVIPTGLDLVYHREHGAWPYQPLLDRMAETDVAVVDFGRRLLPRIEGVDPKSLFDDYRAHYNEQGYAHLAAMAHAVLEERGLLTRVQAIPETGPAVPEGTAGDVAAPAAP